MENKEATNPLSWIISKVVNFRFPPPPVRKDVSKSALVQEEDKPVIVRLPDPNKTVVEPSLKLQAQRDTNPVFLWQVYAIGGFFVLRWVLARWNANNKSSNEQDSPPPTATEADD
ncbi:hypothetical protein QVD17_32381 [Tagetes erecta]|uniref:Uncharacterized protein n=1 Tax=Tagetes erecta TaxID=13708 RepID=A0AAD8KBM4_TARER|nr:hypothetical protein QVD17_32381 [Tagetes erecta]